MMKPKKLQRTLAGLGIVLVVLVLGYLVIRPVHLRWGASDADLLHPMPGALSGSSWTRAILIEATPEQIWPWLVQFGQGRGGWYSYDWLENLLGFDIHTADRLLPEYQNPQIGTPICMSGSFCPSAVYVLEPYRWFGWQATDEAGKPVWTFVFGLFPEGENHTRLVVRESFDPVFMPPAAVIALEIPDVVMELKMLDTLKARAEGRPISGLRFFRPVAIGHLVAEAGAQAGLADGVGDQIERTCDDIRAGMMVNQGGRAVANGVHQADQRAQRYAVRVQGFVQRPP